MINNIHELCICDECGAELYTEPQYDYTVNFVDEIWEVE